MTDVCSIKQGTLRGLHQKTKLSNKPYVSFLGIPYAEPPVNGLRFKPPVEHPGWTGVLEACTEGDKCMQLEFMTNEIVGSEDCLYLNIFVPQVKSNGKLAVMIFIHGGAFNFGCGSMDQYTPDYLLDENVIVVTINYRLNVLGFLNFDIEECPGNMGLKDQLFAIKWVKANISAFGGDADNITIFGESAGSASVHCHMLSPQSTGTFQKAIMQSGCIFNPWALRENHRDIAFKFAKHLGCQNDHPKEIIEYLLAAPAIDLVNSISLGSEMDFLDFNFVPSLESDSVRNQFLPAHPVDLAKNPPPPVPVISGLNSMEGLIALGEQRMKKLDDFYKSDEFNGLFKNRYSEETITKIKNFYSSERDFQNDEINRLENICHLYSDLFFTKDFYHGFNHLLKQNVTPVYNYEFKFDGQMNGIKNIMLGSRPTLRKSLKGACHADELNYLFFGKSFGFVPTNDSPEFKMCKIMSKLWSNFAKTGNPNSSDLNFEWHSTSANDAKYLSIDVDNTYMVDGLLCSSRVKFWESISE